MSSNSLCNLLTCHFPQTKRYLMASPVLLMKAVKSPTEIDGMNNAHVSLYSELSFINPKTISDIRNDIRKVISETLTSDIRNILYF